MSASLRSRRQHWWRNRQPAAAARITVVTVAIAFGLVPLAQPQSVDAVLEGSVRDQTGAALPGTTVLVTNQRTGLSRSATTNGVGRYIVFDLPASAYEVRAQLDGFAPDVRTDQRLHVGTMIRIDFVLTIANVVESVAVRATAPVLEASKNTLTRIVQTAEIDALPVVNRNFNDLAALAPGVTKTGVYGGVDISGSRDFQNAYQVDGVSAERQHLGDQRVTYAQDWIQEFQVMTSQFDAEFGQASGGVLNAITRSGGNRIAARGYGFFRNDAWDAVQPFTTRKPPLSQYRVGATIGGPIVTDRMFYFGGIERFDSRSSSVVRSAFPAANGTFASVGIQTLFLGKLDTVATPNQRFRLRLNGQRYDATGASIGGIDTEEHGRFSTLSANDLVGSWSWITTPAMVNELRAAWSTSVARDGCNLAARNPDGAWFERSYPGARLGCPVNFGMISERQLQLVHNLTWTRGAHQMKVGVTGSWTVSSGNFRNFRDGRYSFNRDIPFSMADPDSYPASFIIIEGPTTWRVGSPSGGLFAQDRWRLTDDLTVNVGARYDLDGSLTALNPLIRREGAPHPIDADRNNVSPRVGFAWTPFRDAGSTMLRGGAGLYFDQNHNNVATVLLLNNVLVDRVLTVSANNRLLNPYWPDTATLRRVLAEALAQNRIPDTTSLKAVAASTNDIDRRLQTPATMQASGGIAHECHGGLSASADFVYARGFDLYVVRDTNLDPVTFRRPNPAYSVVNSFGNGGWNRYRALQVQLGATAENRHLKVGYTLASNRSNTYTTLSGGVATNPFDLSEDEGPADVDARHNLAVNGSLTLPWGVQVSGIFMYRSALPYSAVTSAPRPDGKPFGARPEPRNSRRGDSSRSLDVRLARPIQFGGTHAATLLLEAFNVMNELNYADYIGMVSSALFGRPTTAEPARRVQLGFRVDW